MPQESVHKSLLNKISGIIDSDKDSEAKLKTICTLLKNNIPEYNWVGFYLVDKHSPDELILGPYAGEPTEHVRIKFGQGICGQAAQTGRSFIVNDVSREKNYLSCSIKVKSEIVVPILKNSRIIGEIDIDSHTINAFSETDNEFLKKIAEKCSKLI